MQRQGFSIIELLVALTIMSVITLVAVGNFRAAQQRQEVRGVAQTLASDLHRAQAMSLNGTKTPTGALARGGFGVFFNPAAGTYVLFAEEPFTSVQPALTMVDGLRSGISHYEDITTVTVPSSITLSIVGSSVTTIDFIPPKALPCFADTAASVTSVTPGTFTERLACTSGQPTQVTFRLARTGTPYTYDVVVQGGTGAISIQ